MDAKAEPIGPKGVSLYQRILSEIRGRILSGEWQPGHHIPSENELAAEYGCSRMTANKAMSELAKLGLVERRRRSGSIVSRPRSQAAVLEIHDIRTEVQALGLPYRYELVSRRTATSSDGDGFPSGVRLLHLTSRHFAGQQPFCIEERTISLAAVPAAEAEAFDHAAPGPWLLARIPWSAAEHTIRAIAADDEIASALGLARHAACLVVERRTWSADQPVTRVRLTYAGETHSLVARFAPRRG
jgi:GntR family histidine utilization transcriptional repressor